MCTPNPPLPIVGIAVVPFDVLVLLANSSNCILLVSQNILTLSVHSSSSSSGGPQVTLKGQRRQK